MTAKPPTYSTAQLQAISKRVRPDFAPTRDAMLAAQCLRAERELGEAVRVLLMCESEASDQFTVGEHYERVRACGYPHDTPRLPIIQGFLARQQEKQK